MRPRQLSHRAISSAVAALAIAWLLSGCVRNEEASAPVINGWRDSQAHSPEYRVRPHDTLYSVAWSYGLDYRALAAANNLPSPYHINAGQVLNMVVNRPPPRANAWAPSYRSMPAANSAPAPAPGNYQRPSYAVLASSVAKPESRTQSVRPQPSATRPMQAPTQYRNLNKPVYSWLMPSRGRIVKRFSNLLWGNKGVDIAGRFNQPIVASAAGEVVYAGAGVRGYGNLIILKHNESYLSAYAYNQRVLVKEGAWVQKGQQIATMGRTDAGTVLLHFEIRHNGQPVNPLLYIR